jgi:hypothetical protein
MKMMFAAAFAVLAVQFAVMPPAVRAEDKAPTPQQQRMKDCNQRATGMKGDERKAFMKECLSGKAVAAAAPDGRSAQQEKMKTCNAQASAKALKGDERKAFMSACLKG